MESMLAALGCFQLQQVPKPSLKGRQREGATGSVGGPKPLVGSLQPLPASGREPLVGSCPQQAQVRPAAISAHAASPGRCGHGARG